MAIHGLKLLCLRLLSIPVFLASIRYALSGAVRQTPSDSSQAQDCFCTKELPALTSVPESECNALCTGNATEPCGSTEVLRLYEALATRVPTTAHPEATSRGGGGGRHSRGSDSSRSDHRKGGGKRDESPSTSTASDWDEILTLVSTVSSASLTDLPTLTSEVPSGTDSTSTSRHKKAHKTTVYMSSAKPGRASSKLKRTSTTTVFVHPPPTASSTVKPKRTWTKTRHRTTTFVSPAEPSTSNHKSSGAEDGGHSSKTHKKTHKRPQKSKSKVSETETDVEIVTVTATEPTITSGSPVVVVRANEASTGPGKLSGSSSLGPKATKLSSKVKSLKPVGIKTSPVKSTTTKKGTATKTSVVKATTTRRTATKPAAAPTT